MSDRFIYPVVSKPTVDFLDALGAAANAFQPPFVGGPVNNLPGVPPVNSRRYFIRGIEYLATENVGLEFDFFSSASGLTNVIGTDTFLARYQFASSNGVQFNGTGLYRYFSWGLDLPYYDDDTLNTTTSPSLHVAIQNVDTTAKSAGAPGAITCRFWLTPMTTVQG